MGLQQSLFLLFAMHIVSLRKKVNLSVHFLMAFWLFNFPFDEKVKLRRYFHVQVLIKISNFYHFFLSSPFMYIFFVALLKLHQISVLHWYYAVAILSLTLHKFENFKKQKTSKQNEMKKEKISTTTLNRYQINEKSRSVKIWDFVI